MQAHQLFVIALSVLNLYVSEVCATYAENNFGIKTNIHQPYKQSTDETYRQYDANNYHPEQQHKPKHYYPDNNSEGYIRGYQVQLRNETVQTDRTSNRHYQSQELFTKCPDNFTGRLAYATDCRSFLNCHNGEGHVQGCAPGTLFNSHLLVCDIPVRVSCRNMKKNPSARLVRLMPENVNEICAKDFNGLRAYPNDCTKFINCAHGTAYVQNCGPGTAYDAQRMLCDFAHKVNCVNLYREFPEQNNPQTVDGGSKSFKSLDAAEHNLDHMQITQDLLCPDGKSGNFPHPFDSSRFINCRNGQTGIQNCEYSKTYSISQRRCVAKNHNFGSFDRVSYNIPEVDPQNPLSLIKCPPGTEGMHIYPFTEGKTFHCNANGEIKIDQCHERYNFDISSKSCQQTYNYSQNMTSVTLTNVYSAANLECPIDGNNLSYPYPFNANKYFCCRYNELSVKECPLGYLFSISKRQCRAAETVRDDDCVPVMHMHESNGLHITKDPISLSNRVMCPPKANGSYLHPFDSTKFLNCRSGQIIVDSCPPASVFNITEQRCQWRDLKSNRVDNRPTLHIAQNQPGTTTPRQSKKLSNDARGSLQPQHTQYHRHDVYSVPLATISQGMPQHKPAPTNIYYAQLDHSQENSEEISNNPTTGRVPYPLPYFDLDVRQRQETFAQGPLNDFTSMQSELNADSSQHTKTDAYDLQKPLDFVSDPYDTQQPERTKYDISTGSRHNLETATTTSQNSYKQPPLAHIAPIDSAIPISQIHYETNSIKYSPSYAEVMHSRNSSWPYRSSKNFERHENDETLLNSTAISEALRILLKPYVAQNVSGDIPQQAGSHVMSLVSHAVLTTTQNPCLQEEGHDAEYVFAAEQHHLTEKVLTRKENYPSANSNVEQERSISKPKYRQSSNYHYPHYEHHNHEQHDLDFHILHPHLPNPFERESYGAGSAITNLPNTTANAKPIDNCEFQCRMGLCIKTSKVCDGVNDCPLKDDESNCEHLGYQVRLRGSSAPNIGRVEVKILDKWGYICDDKFGLKDADVLCRELGFSSGASEVRGNSFYSPINANPDFMMDEVECLGNETSLRQCEFNGWGVHNCGPDEVVGVVCKIPLLKCPNNYWLCSISQECIPLHFVCDNTRDCADQSDESQEVCHSPVQYRLEGGRSANEGRLEVLYRGIWGTVCDDDFGMAEAQVACNSLGYFGKPRIDRNIYGPGSGVIWLDQVACFGNESTLEQCSHSALGEHNCNHTEDIGLFCTVGPPSSRTAKGNSRLGIESASSIYTNDEDMGLYASNDDKNDELVRCGRYRKDLEDEFLHPEERVINGTRAKRGRHPWQATIRARGVGGISSHWCGAVLISRQHLLTAAHCLVGSARDSYFIRLGDHYSSITEGTEKDAFIERWYIHEQFREGAHMNNDIALIVLKRKISFNDYIQPICLPTKDTELEANRLCTISGWGSVKSGVSTPSTTLRSAQVPILPDNVCRQEHVYGNSITSGMFCAGTMDESVDACDGDSGGPLACSDETAEALFGIISWGQHCGFANKPGVYVKITKYIDWIYAKINLSLQLLKKH